MQNLLCYITEMYRLEQRCHYHSGGGKAGHYKMIRSALTMVVKEGKSISCQIHKTIVKSFQTMWLRAHSEQKLI